MNNGQKASAKLTMANFKEMTIGDSKLNIDVLEILIDLFKGTVVTYNSPAWEFFTEFVGDNDTQVTYSARSDNFTTSYLLGGIILVASRILNTDVDVPMVPFTEDELAQFDLPTIVCGLDQFPCLKNLGSVCSIKDIEDRILKPDMRQMEYMLQDKLNGQALLDKINIFTRYGFDDGEGISTLCRKIEAAFAVLRIIFITAISNSAIQIENLKRDVINKNLKSMSSPAPEGTVRELAAKYGKTIAEIRKLKSEGRLSELVNPNVKA